MVPIDQRRSVLPRCGRGSQITFQGIGAELNPETLIGAGTEEAILRCGTEQFVQGDSSVGMMGVWIEDFPSFGYDAVSE